MILPKKIRLVEVGPRDGLQNEKEAIPTESKINFINLLSDSGLSFIEVTSFVSPKWVPQLGDAKAVFSGINKRSDIHYSALIPNLEGFEASQTVGVKCISVFAAASETFSQKNTNCSISESLKRIEKVITAAKAKALPVRAYVSCVMGCPYEGSISIEAVETVSRELINLGCDEISLGDTIGVGTVNQTQALIELLSRQINLNKLAVHFHDTYGQALANIMAALQSGISIIDSSVGGLGGCPYAPGAGGNVATEDVLFLLNGLGIETGVEMNKLLLANRYIFGELKRPTRSKAAAALFAKLPY